MPKNKNKINNNKNYFDIKMNDNEFYLICFFFLVVSKQKKINKIKVISVRAFLLKPILSVYMPHNIL